METNNLIGTLRTRKAQLTEALNASLSEKEYDAIHVELASVTKALIIAENQEKARIEKEAADKRKAAIQAHNAGLKKLDQMRKDAAAQDAILFDKISALYEEYDARYKLATQLYEDNLSLQQSAKDLELDVPELQPMSICGMRSPLATEPELFTEILKQYAMAHANLQDAHKKNEQGIPSKPGLEWYSKGSGQFYPRPPEPPIPAKPQRPQV